MTKARHTIGIIGGSGVSEIFTGTSTTLHRVGTPWGAPSGPIQEGRVGDLKVLFLARHGPGHTIPPHSINYRANVDALKDLGAEAILTVSSVGSLKEELPPGTFVLPSQFVDFTKRRASTFFDGGKVYHVSLADPFCPDLTARAVASGKSSGIPFAEGKTYVCVEGPRFSTRAESRYFRTLADVIGMTLVPEVTLARERGLCYVCLAMVTDYDVWAEKPVAAREIAEVMRVNSDRMKSLLERIVPTLNAPTNCRCSGALDEAGL
ncbi:MAG: S-methyl-5'-thioadenosine phosphorylase [Thermoplasmata archaeon]|nr:S-methyl-5'-thioadenosine phosphorylase [Thermoplasmata archaeon]